MEGEQKICTIKLLSYLVRNKEYFSEQLICIPYTYCLNMQTTKTSSISLEIILNTFDSMLTISLSTQILILTIVSLLFILVSILCDLLCCQMRTFYCPPKKKRCSSSWGGRCTHLAAHSSKRLHLLSVTKLVCLGNTQENKTTSSLVLLV